jgi:hypothetical protein
LKTNTFEIKFNPAIKERNGADEGMKLMAKADSNEELTVNN